MKRISLLLVLLSLLNVAHAQYPFPLQAYTDSLKSLGEQILGGRSDFARFEANEKFKQLLIFMISHERGVDIDFQTVKNLSVQGPENRKFRIYTWVVPRTNQSYECFGVLLSWNERYKRHIITELKDVKASATNPERKVFRKGEWWGALYYEMIPVKSNGIQYYTLLGWDGHTATSTRKVIDVLSLSSTGQPTFGASVFTGFGKQMKRIIFEYADDTQMVLRYERQNYVVEKQKKSRKSKQKPPTSTTRITSDGFRALKSDDPKVKSKRKSATMIVFDRLIPLNPSLTGMYEFYVPETNIVDGFLFVKEKWLYVPDIDARNPITPQDNLTPGVRRTKIPPVRQDE